MKQKATQNVCVFMFSYFSIIPVAKLPKPRSA